MLLPKAEPCAVVMRAGPPTDRAAMHDGTSFLSEAILDLPHSKLSSEFLH